MYEWSGPESVHHGAADPKFSETPKIAPAIRSPGRIDQREPPDRLQIFLWDGFAAAILPPGQKLHLPQAVQDFRFSCAHRMSEIEVMPRAIRSSRTR